MHTRRWTRCPTPAAGRAVTGDPDSQAGHQRLGGRVSPLGQRKSFRMSCVNRQSQDCHTVTPIGCPTCVPTHTGLPALGHLAARDLCRWRAVRTTSRAGRPSTSILLNMELVETHPGPGVQLSRDLWLPTPVLAHIWPKAFQWQAEVLAAGTQARPKPTCRLAF